MSFYPQTSARTGGLSSGLLGKVFGLLSFSLAFAVVGGFVGAQLDRGLMLPLVLVQFGMIFALGKWRNLPLLYTFTTISGMTIGIVVTAYVGAGLGGIVLQAAAITAVMTVGLSAYALITKRDFSGLVPYLFVAVLGLVVAGIIGIFVGGGMFQVLLGWAGAIIFSLLLIVDVQRAKNAEDTMSNAIVITAGIYLDIVNIFMSLLRILGGRR